MPKGPQQEKDADEVEGDEAPVEKDKHRWDAADLEKVGGARGPSQPSSVCLFRSPISMRTAMR